MILIFSNTFEYSTLEVCKWLRHLGEDPVCLLKGHNWKLISVSTNEILISLNYKNNSKVINILNAKSVWWRRTGINLSNIISNSKSKFSDEYQSVLNKTRIIGTEMSDLSKFISNKVYSTAKRNLGSPNLYTLNKLEVLEKANKHGLLTPDYRIVTNCLDFKKKNGENSEFITKAINEGIYQTNNGELYSTYTTKHNESDLMEDVNIFPSLRMEMINKLFEIRSFYLNGEFYSMAILSQNSESTIVDFRAGSGTENKHEPYKLPENIEKKLVNLFDELNLNCGSADLIYSTDNKFIFLEINPVGQFAMTSIPCNYNLHYKVAKFLKDGN